MARLDNVRTSHLRDMLDFRESYDIVLACPFEPEEKGDTKFDLYDKIGEVLRSIGKRPYLPHREIDLNWEPRKIYSIVNDIVIPSSDIMLAYLGLPSTATGIMIQTARDSNVPIFGLYEKQSEVDEVMIYLTAAVKADDFNSLELVLKRVYDLL